MTPLGMYCQIVQQNREFWKTYQPKSKQSHCMDTVWPKDIIKYYELHRELGMSRTKIAGEIGCTVGALKIRLQRARDERTKPV